MIPSNGSRVSAAGSSKRAAASSTPRRSRRAARCIQARRFVVATGSRAAVPPIPGLDGVPFFTNESIFENTVLPEHLIVIGAGPIGCELAQAHRRLGSQGHSILDLGPMMPKDDPEAVDVVRRRFAAEGIETKETIKVLRVEKSDAGLSVVIGKAIANDASTAPTFSSPRAAVPTSKISASKPLACAIRPRA